MTLRIELFHRKYKSYNSKINICIVICVICLSFVSTRQVNANNESPSANSLGDSRWYDAEKGAVLPVVIREATDDSVNRGSRWLPKPKKLTKPKSTGTTTGGGTTGTTTGNLSLGNIFAWILIVVIIAVIVFGLVYTFQKADIDFGETENVVSQPGTPDQQTLDRIAELPAELRRTDVNLRSEALRLMQAGQLDQAIVLLFGHQLLMLDRAGAIRLNRGKTNGRYVRECKGHDVEMAPILRETATYFERSYFGRHEIENSEFQRLWAANERLENLLVKRQEVAA